MIQCGFWLHMTFGGHRNKCYIIERFSLSEFGFLDEHTCGFNTRAPCIWNVIFFFIPRNHGTAYRAWTFPKTSKHEILKMCQITRVQLLMFHRTNITHDIHGFCILCMHFSIKLISTQVRVKGRSKRNAFSSSLAGHTCFKLWQ